MNNLYQERLNGIIYDFQSGSREIALKLFSFVREFVTSANTYSWKSELTQYLAEIESHINSMAIIKNIILQIQNFLSTSASKADFLQKIENFEIEFHYVINRIINNLRLEIFNRPKQYTIITCSYSSTINNILIHFSKIFRIDVYLIKSLFKNTDVSEQYINDFANSTINAYSIGLDEIKSINGKVDFGIIGSDAVVIDKYIINGFPSLMLAKELSKLEYSLYVISEKLKFTEEIDTEEGFDKIPICLITKIITD